MKRQELEGGIANRKSLNERRWKTFLRVYLPLKLVPAIAISSWTNKIWGIQHQIFYNHLLSTQSHQCISIHSSVTAGTCLLHPWCNWAWKYPPNQYPVTRATSYNAVNLRNVIFNVRVSRLAVGDFGWLPRISVILSSSFLSTHPLITKIGIQSSTSFRKLCLCRLFSFQDQGIHIRQSRRKQLGSVLTRSRRK